MVGGERGEVAQGPGLGGVVLWWETVLCYGGGKLCFCYENYITKRVIPAGNLVL